MKITNKLSAVAIFFLGFILVCFVMKYIIYPIVLYLLVKIVEPSRETQPLVKIASSSLMFFITILISYLFLNKTVYGIRIKNYFNKSVMRKE